MKLSKADRKGVPADVLDIVEGVVEVATLLGPSLSKAFDLVTEFIASLGTKNPNSPKNVRIRLATVEKLNELQKQVNKELRMDIADLKERLAEQEEIEIVPESTEPSTEVKHEAAGKVLLYNVTSRDRQAVHTKNTQEIARLKKTGYKRISLSYWNSLTVSATAAAV